LNEIAQASDKFTQSKSAFVGRINGIAAQSRAYDMDADINDAISMDHVSSFETRPDSSSSSCDTAITSRDATLSSRNTPFFESIQDEQASIKALAEQFTGLIVKESTENQLRTISQNSERTESATSLRSESKFNDSEMSNQKSDFAAPTKFEAKKRIAKFAVSQGLDWSIVKSAMQNALRNQSEEVRDNLLGEVNKLILEVPYWKKVEKASKDVTVSPADKEKLKEKLEIRKLRKAIWCDDSSDLELLQYLLKASTKFSPNYINMLQQEIDDNIVQERVKQSDRVDVNQKLYSHIVSESNVAPDFYKNRNTPIFDIDSQRK